MKLLTDEEINSIPSYQWGHRQDYARAIESAVLAKLQEQEPVARAGFLMPMTTAGLRRTPTEQRRDGKRLCCTGAILTRMYNAGIERR